MTPSPGSPRRPEPDLGVPWREARPLNHRKGGVSPRRFEAGRAPGEEDGPGHPGWSGEHHDVVRGINLTTLHWTGGDHHIPRDSRFYDKGGGGLSKNGRSAATSRVACGRGFAPECVASDGWYGGPEDFDLMIRGLGWWWPT